MKKIMIGICVACMSLFSKAQTNDIQVEQSPAFIYGNIEAPIVSSFFNRGRLLDDNVVTQPTVTMLKDFEFGTILFNVWQNIDIKNKLCDESLNETDLTLGYTKTVDIMTYNIGIIDYIYTCQPVPNTYEIYMTISAAIPKSFTLNPTLSIYYDFDEADGVYAMVGMSHSFILNSLTITPDVSIGAATSGYNNYYFGVDKTKVNDLSTGLTIAYLYSKEIVISGAVRYGTMLDKEIKDGANSVFGGYEQLTGKISVIYNF